MAGWDIFADIKWGYQGTISYDILTAAYNYPVIPLAAGILLGHLSGPNPSSKSKPQGGVLQPWGFLPQPERTNHAIVCKGNPATSSRGPGSYFVFHSPSQCPVHRAVLPDQTRRVANPPDDPGRQYFYKDGQCTGAYDLSDKLFCPYDAQADKWGEWDQPPWEAFPTLGVDQSKIRKQPTYTLNYQGGKVKSPGRSCRRHQQSTADRRLQQAAYHRDRPRRPGPACRPGHCQGHSRRQRLGNRQELSSRPLGCQPGRLRHHGQADHLLPGSIGKVLHRQDDYIGEVTAAAEALRKAKKNYNPAKDPDLRKADVGPLPINPPQNAQALVYGLAGVAGFGGYYYWRRKLPRG